MTVRTRLIVPVLLGVLASSPALAQGPTGTPQGVPPQGVPPQGVPPQGGQPPPAGQPSGGQAARPIFGGGAAKIGQSLTLGLSVGQTFFRTDADETITRPPARTESTFLYGSGNAAYTVDGLRAGASATVSSSGQYYSELSDQIVRGYAGNVGGWLRFSPRTRLTVDQGVTYLPALQQAFRRLMDPTGGLLNDPTGDVSASDEQWLTYDTRIALAHTFSRRSTLTVDYGRRLLDFRSTETEQVQQDAGFRYTYTLGRGLGVRAGYRYATGRVDTAPGGDAREAPSLHTIDAGLDFNRAFSFSRRTTLGVQTGSAIVRAAESTRFFLVGNGLLSHQMLRTWSATLGAGRDVDFADGFRDPVVSDRATATLGGALARRVHLSTFASAVRGRTATRSADDAFVTVLAGASLSVSISRRIAWTTGYVHQESDFGDVEFLVSPELRSYDSTSTGVSITPWQYLGVNVNYAYTTVGRDSDVVSPRFRRQSLTASVSTSLPLFATVRK